MRLLPQRERFGEQSFAFGRQAEQPAAPVFGILLDDHEAAPLERLYARPEAPQRIAEAFKAA